MIINSHCCDYASVTPSLTTATILVTSMSSGLVTHLSPHLQKNLLPLALSQKQYPNDVSKTDTYKYFCFSNCTCFPSFTHLLQHLSHHLSPCHPICHPISRKNIANILPLLYKTFPVISAGRILLGIQLVLNRAILSFNLICILQLAQTSVSTDRVSASW